MAAILYFVMGQMRSDPDAKKADSLSLVISVDGEVVFDRSLNDISLPFRYTVQGKDGGENVFLISRTEGTLNDDVLDYSGGDSIHGINGGDVSQNQDNAGDEIGVSCIYSDCPEQICVNTGVVTQPDTPIVCLPHRVIARLVAGS